MDGYVLEWANLLLRWLHVITAIAWIGSSFYFVWLDNSLTRPSDPTLLDKGVAGELWAVHGGGFYHPQKYAVAPKSLPEHLHWFYWESYSTWMSGFALFTVLYLFNAGTYLVDAAVLPMSAGAAVGAALGFLVGGWIVYDAICRLFGERDGDARILGMSGDRLVGLLTAVMVAFAAYAACHVFSGRGAFLVVGAMMATIMTANVAMWIIPGQRKVVASMRAGQAPDPIHGRRGKQRSVHNTYFTLPVLFAMLSNHYSMTYAHDHNWLVLILLMAAAVLIRQFFLLRHKGKTQWSFPLAGVAVIVGVAIWIAPAPRAATGARASMAEVQKVVQARCVQCHAAQPTLVAVAPKGVLLDSPAEISRHALNIYQQVVQQKAMPIGNLTQITDAERAVIAAWYESGAPAQ